MFSKKQREAYNIYRDRICEELKIDVNQYNYFRRAGQDLCTIYTDNCNGYINERVEKMAEEREERVTNAVINKTKELGLFVYFQTDPRGATIYLDTKEIPVNNYNRAHCIH